MVSTLKKLSVIIEWKSQDFAEDRRASDMIKALSEHWKEIGQRVDAGGYTFDQGCDLLLVVDCIHANDMKAHFQL